MTKIQRAIVAVAAAGGMAWASAASAQTPFSPAFREPGRRRPRNAAFPLQNPLGPVGHATTRSTTRTPGSAWPSPLNARSSVSPRPLHGTCTGAAKLLLPVAAHRGRLGRRADAVRDPVQGRRAVRSRPDHHQVLVGRPEPPRLRAGHDHLPQRRLLRDRPPRGAGLPGARVGLGAFPNPTLLSTCGAAGNAPCPPVPDGMQWTGLTCNNVGNPAALPASASRLHCPSDASTTPTVTYPAGFRAAYCSDPNGRIPVGARPSTRRSGASAAPSTVPARSVRTTTSPPGPRSASAPTGHPGRREVGERVPQQPRPLPAPRGRRLALRHRPHLHGREGHHRPGRRREPALRRARLTA